MANATPRSYVYGVIGFTFIIVAGVTLFALFASESPALLADERFVQFNESFNTLNDITREVNKFNSTITRASVQPGPVGVIDGLITSAWQALRLMFASFGFMNDAANSLWSVFGIPAWIPALLMLTVTVMIAFTIFSAIFQSEL